MEGGGGEGAFIENEVYQYSWQRAVTLLLHWVLPVYKLLDLIVPDCQKSLDDAET